MVIMTADVTGDMQDLPAESPRAAAAAEPALNPLQRLIQQRLRERGWSYGAVARRGELPRSTVYTLATTRNLARPPRPATIDALAKGLDVPVYRSAPPPPSPPACTTTTSPRPGVRTQATGNGSC